MDWDKYNNLKAIDIGSKDDNYFRGMGFDKGRQGAIDFMHNMRQNDPVEIAKKQAEQARADQLKKEEEQKQLLVTQKAEKDARFTENRSLLTGLTTEFGQAVPQIFDKAYQNFNIGGLLDLTNGLKTRVNDLRDNFSGHGAGGYASATQVDKAINSKYMPKYLAANESLQRGVGLAQNEVATKIQPYTTKIDTMDKQIAREISSYDLTQQRELDTLLSQMQSGVQLTAAQLNLMGNLASSEMQYAATLKKIQADKEIANQQNSLERDKLAAGNDSGRYVTVGDNSYLYDTRTGQIILKPKGSTAKTGW